MKEPPKHIVEEIRRYDPLLRLRWSKEKKVFVLERKTERRFLCAPIKYKRAGYDGKVVEVKEPELSDRHICYHDGYTPIFSAKFPDRRLMIYLYLSDSFRYGKRFVKRAEEREQEKEQKEESKGYGHMRDVSGEVYDSLLVKQGERMFVSG